MSCTESAAKFALAKADELLREGQRFGVLRSVDATEASKWLLDISSELRRAALGLGNPEKSGTSEAALRAQLKLWKSKTQGWLELLRITGNMAENAGRSEAATAYRDALKEAEDSFSRLLLSEAESLGEDDDKEGSAT